MGDDESKGGSGAIPDGSTSTNLLTCAFNQDGGCLAIGSTTGFSIHNLYPAYAVSVRRELEGGIGLVEMLFRCNLMAIVGGGPSPQAEPHRVLIWDDHIPKEIGELSFRQVVLRVKLRKDAIAVALKDRVYVYHLADLSLRDKIYTAPNPQGLLCLSTQVQDMVLACPSVTTGHVRVELYGLRKTQLMEAHDGALQALALTPDGSKLATASTKGTVLRVWDVATGSCIQEYRRGVERATITCLCWSWNYSWLGCTSDKGTAHVFQVQTPESMDKNAANNDPSSQAQQQAQQQQRQQQHQVQVHTRASAKPSKSLTKRFFSSVKKSVVGEAKSSVCQIRGIPHPQACAFVSDATNVLAVAGWDADGNGVLLLSEFVIGDEAKRLGYHVLCKAPERQETEEERRRRRLRGWMPEVPKTPEVGRLNIGERAQILNGTEPMDQFQFDEEDEFITISVPTPNPANSEEGATTEDEPPQASKTESDGKQIQTNTSEQSPAPTSETTETQ